MTRLSLRLSTAALFATAAAVFSACDVVSLPEESTERAAYYVSLNAQATRASITYVTPAGERTDTLVGSTATVVSWSKVFDRSAIADFRMTVRNISVQPTAGAGFVGASLLVDGVVIAHDSSRVAASVSAAMPTIEGAQ